MARNPRRSGQAGSAQRGSANARQRSAAFRAAEAARARRRRIALWGGAVAAVVVVIAAIVIGVVASQHSHSSSPIGPEGIALEIGPVFAPASAAATGQPVDGIKCEATEQVVYHIHAHLAIYLNGTLRPVPPGVGVVEPVLQHTPDGVFAQASRCYYWLHTHAQDGVIHVESPTRRTYTLGQFFAIWQQPLSSTEIGRHHAPVTAYVNGKKYPGDPAGIGLTSHEDIQLDVGTPGPPPQPVDWSGSQL